MNRRVCEGDRSLPENYKGRKRDRGTSFVLQGSNAGEERVSARRWDEFRLVNYINGCGL